MRLYASVVTPIGGFEVLVPAAQASTDEGSYCSAVDFFDVSCRVFAGPDGVVAIYELSNLLGLTASHDILPLF